MNCISKWTVLAPFVLGAILGKKTAKVEVEVPPRIIYFPLDKSEEVLSEVSVDEIKSKLKEIASKYNVKLNEAELDVIASKTKVYLDLTRERMLCLKRIRELSKEFMERRISSSLYTTLIKIYKARLIEVELKLSKIT